MKQELFLLLATVALACGQPTHSPNELLSLPDWLSNFPETKNVTMTASTMAIDVSYNVSGQLDAVVAHYQAELQAGGLNSPRTSTASEARSQ